MYKKAMPEESFKKAEGGHSELLKHEVNLHLTIATGALPAAVVLATVLWKLLSGIVCTDLLMYYLYSIGIITFSWLILTAIYVTVYIAANVLAHAQLGKKKFLFYGRLRIFFLRIVDFCLGWLLFLGPFCAVLLGISFLAAYLIGGRVPAWLEWTIPISIFIALLVGSLVFFRKFWPDKRSRFIWIYGTLFTRRSARPAPPEDSTRTISISILLIYALVYFMNSAPFIGVEIVPHTFEATTAAVYSKSRDSVVRIDLRLGGMGFNPVPSILIQQPNGELIQNISFQDLGEGTFVCLIPMNDLATGVHMGKISLAVGPTFIDAESGRHFNWQPSTKDEVKLRRTVRFLVTE